VHQITKYATFLITFLTLAEGVVRCFVWPYFRSDKFRGNHGTLFMLHFLYELT